jgi:DNA repair exonuclease SbcCD ATPase subunit
MGNEDYQKAYKTAADELESLLAQQEQTEERILALRKTLNVLSTLCQQAGLNTDDLDKRYARLEKAIQGSLTDDICRIVSAARESLTTGEVREELNKLGNNLAEQSNPLATISSILNRLAESGRVHETVKDGKKAWERMSRMAEAFRKFSDEKPKTLGHSFKPGTHVDVSKRKG